MNASDACKTARFQHNKKAVTSLQLPEIQLFVYVIRLGFEPKTHSLEGCCSIQLSYRTGLYLCSIAMGAKVGAKIVFFI